MIGTVRGIERNKINVNTHWCNFHIEIKDKKTGKNHNLSIWPELTQCDPVSESLYTYINTTNLTQHTLYQTSNMNATFGDFSEDMAFDRSLSQVVGVSAASWMEWGVSISAARACEPEENLRQILVHSLYSQRVSKHKPIPLDHHTREIFNMLQYHYMFTKIV